MGEALEEVSKSHYLDDLKRLAPNGVPQFFAAVRAAGEDAFRTTPYPNTRMEEWRQTNIAPIVKTPYRSTVGAPGHTVTAAQIQPFLCGDGAWTELVFVDGYFSEALSVQPKLASSVFAGSLDAAVASNASPQIEQHLGKYLARRSTFTALNSAFLQDGAFIHVPKDVVIEHPIHIVAVTSAREADTAAYLRHLIALEESASASVVTSYVSLAGETRYLNNVVEEIALGQNAQLDRYKIIEEGSSGNHLATAEIHTDRDSRLNSYSMTLTGGIVRNQLCVNLDGEGASCHLSGIYLNDGKRLIDNSINITHSKAHGSSRIAYKGILGDKSKAVFLGKVNVVRDAQQTDSDQLSNNLLLSDSATIDSKPQLEIYADDVKCTHGTTIGPPHEDVVFYFRSRGIDEATARGMLTYGFADEIVAEIKVRLLAERLRKYIFGKYSPK